MNWQFDDNLSIMHLRMETFDVSLDEEEPPNIQMKFGNYRNLYPSIWHREYLRATDPLTL